jgi:type VI secretion system protein ImpA
MGLAVPSHSIRIDIIRDFRADATGSLQQALVSGNEALMAEKIDIESLLAPIPGDDPAGQPLPGDIRRKLDELRREPDAFDLSAGAADKRADWHGVINLCLDTLTSTSKDLLVAIRLIEGLSKRDGFPGLATGLQLTTRLINECWDRLYPKPDPGEDDSVRLGPFLWINHSIKGAKFPGSVANIKLFQRDETQYSYVYLMDTAKPGQKEEFLRVFESMRPKELDEFKKVADSVFETKQALIDLGNALDTRFGKENAPDLTSEENPDNLGRVILSVAREIEKLLRSKGLIDDPGAQQDAAAAEENNSGGSSSASPGEPRTMSREGLYRQIETIADALSRLEPHSPIPFLLRRVVKFGSLSFPELMKEFVRDSSTIEEVNRLLGIPDPQ